MKFVVFFSLFDSYLSSTETAANFYMKMGSLLPKMMDEEFIDAQKLMQVI